MAGDQQERPQRREEGASAAQEPERVGVLERERRRQAAMTPEERHADTAALRALATQAKGGTR